MIKPQNSSSRKKQSIQKVSTETHMMDKFFIILNLCIGLIIGLLGIIYGSMFVKTKYTLMVTGKVIALPQPPNCIPNVNGLYNCTFYVRYEVNNTPYTLQIKDFYSLNEIMVDEQINLFVDPQNPAEVVLSRVPAWIGVILIIFGVAFVLYSFVPLFWMLKHRSTT